MQLCSQNYFIIILTISKRIWADIQRFSKLFFSQFNFSLLNQNQTVICAVLHQVNVCICEESTSHFNDKRHALRCFSKQVFYKKNCSHPCFQSNLRKMKHGRHLFQQVMFCQNKARLCIIRLPHLQVGHW